MIKVSKRRRQEKQAEVAELIEAIVPAANERMVR